MSGSQTASATARSFGPLVASATLLLWLGTLSACGRRANGPELHDGGESTQPGDAGPGTDTGENLDGGAVDGGSDIDGGPGDPDAGYSQIIHVGLLETPSASGDALRAAIEQIPSTRCTTGLVGNQPVDSYLISLDPGIYALGSDPLYMRPCVDIAGAGEDLTLLVGDSRGDGSAVVNGIFGAELRSLSVQANGAGVSALALEIPLSAGSFRASNLTVSAVVTGVPAASAASTSPASQDNTHVSAIGIELRASSSGTGAMFIDVTSGASGAFLNIAIRADSGSASFNRVTAVADGAGVGTAIAILNQGGGNLVLDDVDAETSNSVAPSGGDAEGAPGGGAGSPGGGAVIDTEDSALSMNNVTASCDGNATQGASLRIGSSGQTAGVQVLVSGSLLDACAASVSVACNSTGKVQATFIDTGLTGIATVAGASANQVRCSDCYGGGDELLGDGCAP